MKNQQENLISHWITRSVEVHLRFLTCFMSKPMPDILGFSWRKKNNDLKTGRSSTKIVGRGATNLKYKAAILNEGPFI